MKVYFAHIFAAFLLGRSSAENLLRHGAPTSIAANGHRFATGTDPHVCTDEDELVLCDTSVGESCVGMEINQCSNVLCQDACDNAKISESNVVCVRDNSCTGATFRKSNVQCTVDSLKNCRNTKFYTSAATCESASGWYYDGCHEAQFNQCSCCEGPGCPSDVPRCYDDDTSSDTSAFCASELSGRTCKEWGNPICNEGGEQNVNLHVPEINTSDSIPRAICAGHKLDEKPILIATIGSSQGSFQVKHEGDLPLGVKCEHDHHGDSNSEVEVYLKGRPDPTMEKGLYELKLHAIGEDPHHSPTARRVPIITSNINLRFSYCGCRKYRCGKGKFRVCKSQTATQDSKAVCVGFRRARRLLARGGICGRCGPRI